MGKNTNLKKFIRRINADYFASKLCVDTYDFSSKISVRNVRKFIKDEL